MYRNVLKPFFDKFSALLILLVLSPALVIAAIALAISNKGDIWFRQQRPGLNEKLFQIVKFKTMNDQRDTSGNLMPDDQRLTPVGKIIRATSLDEVPQLFNVLSGEMSIVGPRPLLVEYLGLYNEVQKRRHEVKPGITGWAQVNGRNTVEWSRRFEYDVWYVDHQTFWLDLRILALTIIKVFQAEGISSPTSETMEKFRGNI